MMAKKGAVEARHGVDPVDRAGSAPAARRVGLVDAAASGADDELVVLAATAPSTSAAVSLQTSAGATQTSKWIRAAVVLSQHLGYTCESFLMAEAQALERSSMRSGASTLDA